MQWLMYGLVFIAGYLTCKALYFMKSTRLSLRAVRASHLIYLSVIIKALENLSYSRELTLESLAKSGETSAAISIFEMQFDTDVRHIKEHSIETLKHQHPDFFKPFIEFDDWESSMDYLMTYKKSALQFWNER